MPQASSITGWILLVVMTLLYCTPGYTEKTVDRPQKGFWRVRDVLWPIRQKFLPAHPKLLNGYSLALIFPALISFTSDILARSKHFAQFMSPTGLFLEVAALGFFFGRASGYWSADRKLQKDAQRPEIES